MNVYSNHYFYEILYAMYESCVNLFINTFIDLSWIWEKYGFQQSQQYIQLLWGILISIYTMGLLCSL